MCAYATCIFVNMTNYLKFMLKLFLNDYNNHNVFIIKINILYIE